MLQSRLAPALTIGAVHLGLSMMVYGSLWAIGPEGPAIVVSALFAVLHLLFFPLGLAGMIMGSHLQTTQALLLLLPFVVANSVLWAVPVYWLWPKFSRLTNRA